MHHKHKQLIKFFKYLCVAILGYLVIHLILSYLYSRFYMSKYTYVSGRPYGAEECHPAPILPPSHKTIRILVLPGGAINGILPIHILKYLESKTHQPVHKLFDLIAATSTGSLIAAGLTYPNKAGKAVYNTDDVLKFYTKFGPYALSAPWWYRAITLNGLLGPRYLGTRLRNELEKIFNKNVQFNQLLTPTMISTYDLSKQKSYTFTTWSCSPYLPAYHVHEILTAATATPGFFPPVRLQDINAKTNDIYIDGGIAVNNPGMLALKAAMTLYPNRNYLIVILNTGNILKTIHWNTVNQWGAVSWLPKVLALLLTTQENQAVNSLRFVQSLLPPDRVRIIPINFKVNENASKFNPSEKNIALLKRTANQYIKKHQQTLSKLADDLSKDGQ